MCSIFALQSERGSALLPLTQALINLKEQQELAEVSAKFCVSCTSRKPRVDNKWFDYTTHTHIGTYPPTPPTSTHYASPPPQCIELCSRSRSRTCAHSNQTKKIAYVLHMCCEQSATTICAGHGARALPSRGVYNTYTHPRACVLVEMCICHAHFTITTGPPKTGRTVLSCDLCHVKSWINILRNRCNRADLLYRCMQFRVCVLLHVPDGWRGIIANGITGWTAYVNVLNHLFWDSDWIMI